ncbi:MULTISPECIES: YdcF family protein [Spirulina sp. CCY15215]|uniref:YdcF family protein n=1 Tax=Spirulina sp. CCY15215 TaxID=2767591 RepID=UPI00194EBDEF|nr:YdcF family protein [Spirulina major]
MIEVLSIVLLSILILLFLYFLIAKIIPTQALAITGGAFLIGIILISYLKPTLTPVSTFWSILSFPLKPLGLSLLFFLLAVRKIDFKKGDAIKKPGHVFLTIGIIILLVSSNPYFAYQSAYTIEKYTVETQQDLRDICVENCLATESLTQQIVGAIVLLGQNTTEPYIPYRTQIQFNRTGNRIFYTTQLYYQQRNLRNSPKIIICASQRNYLSGKPEQVNEAQDIAGILRRLGIPNNSIIQETRGLNLRMNAVEVEKILGQERLLEQPVFLVTSGIKMRRAVQTFRKEKIRVIPTPTDFYTFQKDATPKRRITVRDILPSVDALSITTDIVDEYLASIYYLLRGWLYQV